MKCTAILLIVTAGLFPAGPLAAQYKPEFKMSINPSEETSWGRAAVRFAAAIKYRTKGRIQITNYFEGRASGGAQTTEFQLLQEGVVDFSIGSTINWSPQVKELNLFALPFMFPSYSALDAVEAGDPGKRRPEDLHGLNIRVVGIPIFVETFQALGANPVSINFNEALGFVDGQNVTIEYRWAAGRDEQLPAMAVELVNRPVAVLLTGGSPWSTISAKAATATIPIVFTTTSGPSNLAMLQDSTDPAAMSLAS